MASIPTTTVEEEFEKNPDLKKEDLASLRRWLAEYPHFPAIPERQLILFLHSCYYNIENTKSCIENYYTVRSNTPYFFKDRDVSRPELQTALKTLVFCEFPGFDPNGYVVGYHRLRDTEPSHYVFNDGVKLLFMGMDAGLHKYGSVPGFVIVFDMKGVRLGHLTRLNLRALHRFFIYVQEANPIRLKAVHVLNTSSLIDKVMFLIKPFIKKEFLELIHFHKGDNSTIYQYLPKRCLPVDYGGELPSVEELHTIHCENLQKLQPFFEEEESFRIDESKKPRGKKKTSSSYDSLPPPEPVSIQSLEID
ncbi:alpha-tocopherol transfer protein-like [Anabrus simplex]|uniref:alpha-tocopherol transfer protein-like n=1 Tax=Anabrus simplex TaxID=316456 RepID=UPI0035A310E2